MIVKNLVAASFLLVFNLSAFSQLNKATVKNSYEIKKEIPSKSYLQFTKALKPSAVKGGYEKQMKEAAAGVNAEMTGEMMTKKIVSLSATIKPEMMKKGFKLTPGPFTKTMGNSMILLKELEDGLKPEAFNDGWRFQRNAWLEEIGKIK